MKFFLCVTLISSYLSLNWAYPYGVQDIPEPSHLLSYLYSTLRNQQPKDGDPSIACSILETPVVIFLMTDLSTSSPIHLYLRTGETQHAYEHDPCLQHPFRICTFSESHI